ncbi:MAG: 50S ribosomal protein L11 methyltransferase [Clostridia bacterium]|nr:50S ribosomal protein L11 methyltransferase [Clostridia bacterium]
MSISTAPEGATTYNAGSDPNPWTELRIVVPAERIDDAAAIAQMTVPYGLYMEDYRDLETEVDEIAHIDLIDEDLLARDRSKGIVHVYLEPGENPAEAVAFLTERYAAAGITQEISCIPCKREDWQNNWKKYFRPMEVGEKLLIQPSWEDLDPEVETDRTVLHLEPGLAFGTGTHDTTRLCLETLEERIFGGESVLDLGCGSGILSLSALLLGARSATGVDIDELAVKTAVENGRRNGFVSPQYEVFCGDMTEQITGTYDLVVANIVADIIVLFCKSARQFMHDNSLFLVSGIIATREEDVLRAFSDNGFTVVERKQSGEWLCFVLQ